MKTSDQTRPFSPPVDSDEERLPPRSDDDDALEAPPKTPFKPPLIGYLQQNNPAFFPEHRHSAKPRPRGHTRVTLPGGGTDGAHLDASLVEHPSSSHQRKRKPHTYEDDSDSDASSPKPKAKGKRRKRKDEFAGTDVYIPGIPKHTINKIKIGAYVDITDCIPSYDEQREDGITFTLDGRTRVTRIPGSRPALPMSFCSASVLCRM